MVVLLTIFLVGPLFYSGQNYWDDGKPLQYLWNLTIFKQIYFINGVFSNIPEQVINGSLWTLPIEIYSYFGLFILSLLGALNLRVVVVILCFILLVHQQIIPYDFSVPNVDKFHFFRLSVFFWGGTFLAFLKNRLTFNNITLFFCVGIVFLSFLGHEWPYWHQPILFMLLWPYIIVCTAIQLKKLHWLDKYDCSYGIYIYSFLIQQSLIATFGPHHINTTQLTLLTIIVTVPIALASWFLIEKPALSLKNKLLFFQKYLSMILNRFIKLVLKKEGLLLETIQSKD